MSNKISRLFHGFLGLLLIAFFATVIWFQIVKQQKGEVDAINPGISFKLSDVELHSLTLAAEKGDVFAMKKLVDYYGIYQDTPSTEANYHYWMSKIVTLAKAGNPDAKAFFEGSSWESYDEP